MNSSFFLLLKYKEEDDKVKTLKKKKSKNSEASKPDPFSCRTFWVCDKVPLGFSFVFGMMIIVLLIFHRIDVKILML